MSWQPLTGLEPSRNDQQIYEYQFPDRSEYWPERWNYLTFYVVEWLWENRHLKADDCPISRAKAQFRYLVHTEPYHQNGSPFSPPDCYQAGELYIDTKYNCDKQVENARIIIRRVAPGLLAGFKFRRPGT